MGANDQDINVTIKARDEASAAIVKLTSSIEALTKKIGDVSKASESMTDAQKKTAATHESMTAAVFKGSAAWDILKKSIGVAKDFMIESTEAYLDAQKQIDLTRAVVESMGQSFDVVGPKLKEFGDKMAKMGTDDEAAALAAAKLAKAAGGDLAKGMQLAKLAADLTSSGYNDFAGNVDNLTRVLSGKGQRALIDYRVNLNDTATTSEQLAAIQGKVTQKAEEFADTIPGKINTVQIAYQNLKEEVGKGIVDAFINATATGGGMNDTLDLINGSAKVLKGIAFELANGITVVTESFAILAKTMLAPVHAASAFGKAMGGDFDGAMKEATDTLEGLGESTDAFGKAMEGLYHPVKAMETAETLLNEQRKKATESAKKEQEEAIKVANANTTAAQSAEKLTAKYGDLASAFTKVRQTAADELEKLKSDHIDAVKTITDKIADLKKSLKDLASSYSDSGAAAEKAFGRQAADDSRSVGESIVAQQQKIADLKKQAGLSTDPQEKINLLDQLKKEQDAYDGQAAFITSKATEVSEAKRRAGLTDFERQIEDYKNKRALADQDFADARADALKEYSARKTELKKQLDQEQAKLDEEKTKYNKAHDAITKILADAEAMRLDTTKKTSEQILKLVDQQIDRYNRLADAIQRASQGKATQLAPSSNVPIREHGGLVPGPVGMAVPIIAHGQERIIPASQTNNKGGGIVAITINNPSVRSDNDLVIMRNMIEDAFRDVSRVHKLTNI